jgi:hypothetical protein
MTIGPKEAQLRRMREAKDLVKRALAKKVAPPKVVARAPAKKAKTKAVVVAEEKRPVGRPPGEVTKMLSLALPPALIDRLDAEQRRLQMPTRTSMIRQLIEKGLP